MEMSTVMPASQKKPLANPRTGVSSISTSSSTCRRGRINQFNSVISSFSDTLVHYLKKKIWGTRMCSAVADLLWLEELAVRLELEEEVSDVGEQHDDAAGAGEVEARGGSGHGVLAGAHGVAQHQRQRVA
jgi:hypothetical protein